MWMTKKTTPAPTATEKDAVKPRCVPALSLLCLQVVFFHIASITVVGFVRHSKNKTH